MKRVFILTVMLATFMITESCNDKKDLVLTKEVTFTKEGELRIKKTANDSLLANLDIEIADDEYQTQTGLMYRKSMESSQGMLFVFKDEIKRSFYMKNTEFALDIIFINSANKVVSIQKNAKPLDHTSLPSAAPSLLVLEVNAGLSDQWNLMPGDKIEWTSIPKKN